MAKRHQYKASGRKTIQGQNQKARRKQKQYLASLVPLPRSVPKKGKRMTAAYAKHFSTLVTPQSEPIPGKPQVQNSAGGFAFAVDDWTRLDRFLILGCEGGTYYAGERKLTVENAQAVLRCWASDPKRTAARIAEISEAGRAPKNDPAIFALAIGSKHPEALAVVSKVCRIGTHIFQFAESAKAFRGWGRALRTAIARWYTDNPGDLAYQLIKYQQRNGWSHHDLMHMAHPKFTTEAGNVLARWVKTGWPEVGDEPHPEAALRQVWAFERAKRATDKREIARLIVDYNLPRECVPTQFLAEPSVWEALLEKMPLAAMVRNLATMTRVGLLAPLAKANGKVLAELANVERIRKSRLHPVAILAALLTYRAGRGDKSAHTWSPIPQIVDALDGAFYLAFGNVEPTNRRWLLALDVSGSMDGGCIAGVQGLTPRIGAAAMSLVTAATESQHAFVAFTAGSRPSQWSRSHGVGSGITTLGISPRQRLDDVCQTMRALPMGGTDCALPMLWALENKIPVDVFVVLTDNETWAGNIHPCQALTQYRQRMGIAAKLVVVGMTATPFTIADPSDGGMMDVVGFDTATPQIMADFAR